MDIISTIASLVTIIGGTLAGVLGLFYWRGRSPLVDWTLRHTRDKTLGALLTEYGFSKKQLRTAVRLRSVQVAREALAEATLQEEVEWLEDLSIQHNAAWQRPLIIRGVADDRPAPK